MKGRNADQGLSKRCGYRVSRKQTVSIQSDNTSLQVEGNMNVAKASRPRNSGMWDDG